jgi:hypothetical protein
VGRSRVGRWTVHEPTMTRIVLTYEDFVALPDDANRYEPAAVWP